MFFRSLFLSIYLFSCCFLQADIPSECSFKEGVAHPREYSTPRGNKLRYAHFISPLEGPKNTILFLQGRGTFLEYYEEIVTPLLERGFDVWMYDLSGQGGSTRLWSDESHDAKTLQHVQHIDDFDLYVEDMHAFISEVLLPCAEGRLILGGYSTGGHVALRYLQLFEHQPFESCFVISPLLALKIPLPNSVLSPLLWATSWAMDLYAYVPGASHEDPIFAMDFEKNPYTSDEGKFKDIKELCVQHRPLVMGGISYGWLKAASNSLELLWDSKNVLKITIPILIGTGGEDGVVDVRYNELFTKSLRRAVHVYYPQGRHELFREVEEIRSDWWAAFDSFMAAWGP